ncbi:hypothetical protein [Nocardioides sp.]|uniref:hypothetical protein n=1 Tax=Nocardioides sp. TaxID=35761 RepID=UPI002D7FAA2D|nr:hypothetical protein [Nocardioides sp.]
MAAVFGLTLMLGRGTGPVGVDAAVDTATNLQSTSGSKTPARGADSDLPGGLMVSSAGYSFDLVQSSATPGRSVSVSFRITGPDGEAVTAYDIEHEKRLHLIAVRRDFSGFQHVHPTLAADGRWSTDLSLTAGDWRLFADFKPTGSEALTLGTDLPVAGSYQPVVDTDESRTSTVDGYDVTIDGELVAGTDSRLTLNVTKDDKQVTDLQPYLGAYGHLVALREGDLAYLHVHPEGTPSDGVTEPGPDVVFFADVPSTGDYRLFLDFQHNGVVRTASFALGAANDGAAQPSTPTPAESGHNGHNGH